MAPPGGWWNRVVGFQPADITKIDEIVAFYRDGAWRCHIDLDALTPEVGQALAARIRSHSAGSANSTGRGFM